MSSRLRLQSAVLFAVSLCFLLSGFAALLYQIAWMRQISTVFGTSELAVATVLAANMACWVRIPNLTYLWRIPVLSHKSLQIPGLVVPSLIDTIMAKRVIQLSCSPLKG